MGGIPSLVGAAGGAGGGSSLLPQLQQAEQAALNDMQQLMANQIQFQEQMTDVKSGVDAAKAISAPAP